MLVVITSINLKNIKIVFGNLKMINYYDEMENVSDDYLKYINSHLKWFKEINRNERFNRIDFTAIDKKERTVSIETKIRMNNIFTYKSTYIEVDKYNNLIEDFKKTGRLPLFLNFLSKLF